MSRGLGDVYKRQAGHFKYLIIGHCQGRGGYDSRKRGQGTLVGGRGEVKIPFREKETSAGYNRHSEV